VGFHVSCRDWFSLFVPAAVLGIVSDWICINTFLFPKWICSVPLLVPQVQLLHWLVSHPSGSQKICRPKVHLYSLKVHLVFCFTPQSHSVLTSPHSPLSKSAGFVAWIGIPAIWQSLNRAKIARLPKSHLYSLKVHLVFCFTSQSHSVLTFPCTPLSKSARFVAWIGIPAIWQCPQQGKNRPPAESSSLQPQGVFSILFHVTIS
jgi:hypothetical protein